MTWSVLISTKNIAILIAVYRRWQIVEICDKLQQLEYQNIYFYIGKSNRVYGSQDFWQYECKKILWKAREIIPYIEMHVLDYCNLNCVNCTHYAALFDVQQPDFNERLENVKKLCGISANILSFFIMGGEPFLNVELNKYIEEIRIMLKETDIQIVTNGLLIPQMGKNLLRTIKENKIVVSVSEYEPTHKMRDAIVGCMEDNEIEYIIRPYDKKQKFYRSLSKKEVAIDKCISDGCVNIYKGKIARCPNLMYVEKINQSFDLQFPEEGIYDLQSFKTAEELNDRMNAPVPLCKYCSSIAERWHICKKPPVKEDFVY